MAFVKLLNKNGTTLKDEEHDLCLYKVNMLESWKLVLPVEQVEDSTENRDNLNNYTRSLYSVKSSTC